MNTQPDLLERWGRFAVRRRWYVIATWVVVAAVLDLTWRAISPGTVNTLTIPGAESQEAVEVLQRSIVP